jgi:hypothetical protein
MYLASGNAKGERGSNKIYIFSFLTAKDAKDAKKEFSRFVCTP